MSLAYSSSPARFEVDTLAERARELPDGAPVRVAGRVIGWRQFGGLTLGHIRDRSGRLQVALRRDQLPEGMHETWSKAVSLGDFIGAVGEMWTTKRGERTVDVRELTLLTKAVRPMPDKWVGVSDPEVRARKRYLDLLMDDEVRERFRLRTRLITAMREFLDDNGFIEVETPILQEDASGASARPFVTHHNALDTDFFLRIAPETYLKRVIAGSFDRVYEIGRNFRNEGIDPSHLQEFTMLEWYASYWDYRDNMAFTREFFRHILRATVGERITYGDVELDFGGEWPVVDYVDEVRARTGVNLEAAADVAALEAAIAEKGLDVHLPPNSSYATGVDLLYKRYVRPHLVQPCFLVHHPSALVPLARRLDDDPSRLAMFQVVANGWELVKAYSELVDPVEQRSRLEEQRRLREQGDDEAMALEEDFIEAMEHGMPPMSGLGLGVDRLVALLTDAPSIRDTVLFPQLRRRPQHDTPAS
jgi:lysyl-tRNA synthetase, class II